MKRFIVLGLILVFLTTACSAVSQRADIVEEEGLVTIFALDG